MLQFPLKCILTFRSSKKLLAQNANVMSSAPERRGREGVIPMFGLKMSLFSARAAHELLKLSLIYRQMLNEQVYASNMMKPTKHDVRTSFISFQPGSLGA